MRNATGAVRIALLGLVAAACDQWLTQPTRYNTVDVSATRRNGDAIAGVELELYTGQRPMGYGKTDATGRYQFTLVPDGLYGVRAAVLPDGYVPVEALVAGPPTTAVSGLAIKGQATVTARFSFLKRGPGSVSVRLIDDAGTPLAGIFATLYTPAGVRDSVPTDAAGTAVFSAVPFGVHGVSVPRTAPYRDIGESAFAERDGLLVEDGMRETATLTFARCSGSIRVTVREENGNPVASFPLSLFLSTGIVQDSFTDAAGTFTFAPLNCAEYGVRLVPLAGWTFAEGRGTSFIDGLRVTRSTSPSATFTIRRN